MRLQIENFAKLKKADITIDGITVIAGENNSGKSTVGKILFSLFNATSDIEEKILDQRDKEIKGICRNRIRNLATHSAMSRDYLMISRKITDPIFEILQSGNIGFDELEKSVYLGFENEKEMFETEKEKCEFEKDLVNRIAEVVNISDYELMLEILTRYFNNVFNSQINSLIDLKTEACLNLLIRNSNMGMRFSDNKCIALEKNIEIVNKAVYIDNPFVIDKLSRFDYFDEIEFFLKRLLMSHSSGDVMEGVIGSVLAKEKLSDVYKTLSSVVPGKILEKQENEYYLEQIGLEKPVAFNRLSTGIKSFLVIKMLLEKGCIKEKDILVLDEPEIHLHPKWQVVYAELIVLLQKYFDLSVVITTHSPYFLDAINIFSVKHGSNKKTNFYLSFEEGQWVRMENVTNNIECIYQKMASPIQMLDSLRYELNNL